LRQLSSTTKGEGAVVLIAVGYQLDLHDAFAFALLHQERVENNAAATIDVFYPVLVQEGLELPCFLYAIDSSKGCKRFARWRLRCR
jgi:hypothetical protein